MCRAGELEGESMTEVNKLGLSRHIPDSIRRESRQACGFGCVACGASIVEYEHIDPEFSEAVQHDPAAIALLCHSCHGNVTRKFWSKEKIKAARQSPRCKQTGFSWGAFDLGDQQPFIKFAGILLRKCPIPITVAGTPVFSIRSPEVLGGPFRLSAMFQDAKGTPVLRIVDNEWQAIAQPWDLEFSGGKIIIRQQAGMQCLVLRAEPPDGIAIERLQMKVGVL